MTFRHPVKHFTFCGILCIVLLASIRPEWTAVASAGEFIPVYVSDSRVWSFDPETVRTLRNPATGEDLVSAWIRVESRGAVFHDHVLWHFRADPPAFRMLDTMAFDLSGNLIEQ